MTTLRGLLILFTVMAVLTVLGVTSERTAARLAWVGVALLSLTVGLWSVL